MIPGTPLSSHPDPEGWQRAMQRSITDARELVECLALGEEWVAPAEAAAARFGLRIPRGYVARMRRGDPTDPLLRQVLPLGLELFETPGFVSDPVGDLHALAGPGLLHKYRGRALLVTTGACAIHCRYCFRREFPYSEQNPARGEFAEALAAIRADATLSEIILSGGDPLTLSDRRLHALLLALEAIPHVRRVRVHTRLPIVLPERIDAAFMRTWNSPRRLQKIVVIHANHANEIRGAPDVQLALSSLGSAGTFLLNQSVLLRSVNDSADALVQLSECLFEAGVLPYYLHLLDPVRGAAHFDVPEDEARALLRDVSARLPGYLVPKLVQEVPGAASKTMLPPASR